MSFCRKCGNQLNEGTPFCPRCGERQDSAAPQYGGAYGAPSQMPYQAPEMKHTVPKCQSCGYIGEWKMGPVLRPMDYVIGVIFLFLGVFPGIIYLGVVAAIRSNPDRREKICKKCGGKNLFTFLY